MNEHDLASMVSARLCHDLISPLGAIGNGLELLQLSPGAGAEEISLISDSLGSALAKLRFFRVAFGPADSIARISGEEVSSITEEMFSGRVKVVWTELPGDAGRALVRLVFLSILCLEKSLPMGGTVHILMSENTGTLSVEGRRVTVPEELWAHLTQGSPASNLRSDGVQFAMLRKLLEANQTSLTALYSDTSASITLGAMATETA